MHISAREKLSYEWLEYCLKSGVICVILCPGSTGWGAWSQIKWLCCILSRRPVGGQVSDRRISLAVMADKPRSFDLTLRHADTDPDLDANLTNPLSPPPSHQSAQVLTLSPINSPLVAVLQSNISNVLACSFPASVVDSVALPQINSPTANTAPVTALTPGLVAGGGPSAPQPVPPSSGGSRGLHVRRSSESDVETPPKGTSQLCYFVVCAI